jgi:trimeric autotransporter adhesin
VKQISQMGWAWVLSAIAAAPVYAQSSTPVTPPTDLPVSAIAADLRIAPRATVHYSTSGGGYDGFARFQGFMPLDQTPGKSLLYLLGQLSVDNDANLGGNLLVGYRAYSPAANRLYGGYLAYDNRDTGFNGFSQLGLGLETLGKTWDARINVYVPVGSTRQTVSETATISGFQLNGFRFQNNFLLATGTGQQTRIRDREVAMSGFDAEVGGRILRLSNSGDLRGYAGLYYLAAGESVLGIRGRLEARPTEALSLGLAVQHDSVFGTNAIATVSFSFPGTRPRGAEPNAVLARMGEDPSRLSAIVVDRQREVTLTDAAFPDILVQNPATGQPYVFQHVTLGAASGNGTVETPFGQVAPALAATRPDGNAIVYVQAGNNAAIPTFRIPDRVQVLSTGPVQLIAAALPGQVFPALQLPLSGAGTLPNVNGTIMMSSDTVLSGFNITSATGAGVTFTNVNRVEIRDNVIRNTADAGILGNGVAIANLFRNQITSAQNQGIYVVNGGTTTVTDNVIANTRAGTAIISNPITTDLTIGSITIPNPGSVIPLPAGQGIVIATVNGNTTIARNTVTGTATQGIVLLNATGSATLTDNTIANTVGANFTTNVPPLGNLTVTTGQGIVVAGVNGNLEVSRNRINTVRGQGLVVAGSVNGTTTVANNTIRNTVDQGMVIGGTSGTTTIANNQISDVATRNVTLTPPPLIGPPTLSTLATGQGLALLNATGTVNITGNTIERVNGAFSTAPLPPGGQGLAVAAVSGQLDLNITNNQVRNNFNDGVLIGLAGRTGGTTTPATANITLSGNTIENNGGATPVRGDGIAIGVEQNAVVNSLLIENNVIRGNGDEGIDIRLGQEALPIVNPTTARLTGTIRNNTITGHGQNGIQVEARGATTARVTIENNTSTLNGQRGLFVTTSNLPGIGSPQISATVRLNTLTNNTGVSLQAQTTAIIISPQTLCVNVTGNTANRILFTNPVNFPANTLSSVGNLIAVSANNTLTLAPQATGALTVVTACP